MSAVAERILDGIGPAARAQAGPVLQDLVQSLATPAAEVDTLVQPGSRAGWASAFDLDTSPYPRWLAQLVGVNVPGGLTDDQVRVLVRDRPAQRRGTPAALLAAVRATLQGGRRAELLERVNGNAYATTVRVYQSEIPNLDVTAVERAAAAQKPVGLVVTVQVLSGATVEHMRTIHGPTVSDYLSRFPTVRAAADHIPE